MWKSNSQAQKKYNYIRISNKKITFMKRSLIFIIAVLSFLSVHAQKKSLLDYPEISLGVYADGKPVLCRFVPADLELKYFVFTPDLPLLLVSDEHAYHMFNTETCEELSEGKFKGKELAQITMDGILVYSPDNLFSFHYGRPTFLNLKGDKVWTNKDVLAFASRTLNVSLCLDKKRTTKSTPTIYLPANYFGTRSLPTKHTASGLTNIKTSLISVSVILSATVSSV